MSHVQRSSGLFLTAFLLAALVGGGAGCASAPKAKAEDPLKYTKKHVKEGHRSLYQNGAFQVPNTSIRLIPAGPSAVELAGEMMGIRARESFTTALTNAADSVVIVSEGAKFTYRTAERMHETTEQGVAAIRSAARENSTQIVYKSTELGKSIAGKSWELAKGTFAQNPGGGLIRGSRALGRDLGESGTHAGLDVASSSLKTAGDLSTGGVERAGKALSFAGKSFITGYATVPAKMRRHAASMGDNIADAGFVRIIKEENVRRGEMAQESLDLLSDTVRDYGKNVAASFRKAGGELRSGAETTGLSLAVLKSLRWVLQGILWDATVKPVSQATAASIGYIGVNLAAFPAMVVVREGVATTKLAVEVTWDAAGMGYDLVAPTGTAAVAGVYGMLDFTGSQLAAGAVGAAGSAAGVTAAAASKTAAVVVKGGGYAAGTAVQYIGVPLASAGIVVGGGTIGTAVGGAGAVTGGAVRVTGETAAVATEVFGNVITGAALVGGTAVSAAGGAAYGVYQVSKAVAVPAGYEVGGGIVLSYGTLSHLAAHSVLAASDCAYLVLSLEGPRWVLYAVKGKVSSGDDVSGGAVVDLKKLREQGEELYYIPVSDEEMKKVVESVYDNLPEGKQE